MGGQGDSGELRSGKRMHIDVNVLLLLLVFGGGATVGGIGVGVGGGKVDVAQLATKGDLKEVTAELKALRDKLDGYAAKSVVDDHEQRIRALEAKVRK